MQKEIKFRGNCIDENTINTGKMVFGFLIKIENYTYIIEVLGEDSFIWNKVNPETVGQYTGLKDKNGKEIFEGDIVTVKHGNGYQTFEENVQVDWDEYGFSPMNWQYECDGCSIYCEILEIIVIGNIHDNPELLQEVDNAN